MKYIDINIYMIMTFNTSTVVHVQCHDHDIHVMSLKYCNDCTVTTRLIIIAWRAAACRPKSAPTPAGTR